MPLVTCPECGHRISDLARACVRCGAPNAALARPAANPYAPPAAPPAYAAPPRASGVPAWGVIAIVVVVGGVLGMGVLAAIAIPKFAAVSAAAVAQREAMPVLTEIRALQDEYWRAHDEYAASLEALPGWSDPGARYFTFSVSDANAATLCIEATPTALGREREMGPVSMDESGSLYGAAGCTGPNYQVPGMEAATSAE